MLAKVAQNAFTERKVAVSFLRTLENDRDLRFFANSLSEAK